MKMMNDNITFLLGEARHDRETDIYFQIFSCQSNGLAALGITLRWKYLSICLKFISLEIHRAGFNPLILQISTRTFLLDWRYFWLYLLNREWFYNIFAGELLAIFWSNFLLQIFYELSFNLNNFIKVVRLVMAITIINGLNRWNTSSHSSFY